MKNQIVIVFCCLMLTLCNKNTEYKVKSDDPQSTDAITVREGENTFVLDDKEVFMLVKDGKVIDMKTIKGGQTMTKADYEKEFEELLKSDTTLARQVGDDKLPKDDFICDALYAACKAGCKGDRTGGKCLKCEFDKGNCKRSIRASNPFPDLQ